FMEDRESVWCVEVIIEGSLECLPRRGCSLWSVLVDRLSKASPLSSRLLQRLIREVDRLRPMRRHEEQQQRLAPPAIERLADGDDVPLRLRHLLAREPQHPVVRPDVRELVADRARLRELVLVVREDEVEPAAVDLELLPEELLRHHRALDVPAGAAAAPRGFPPGVLSRFVRLPEGEVARILLARIRNVFLVLALDLVDALARELPVVGIARNAKVDVPVRVVRVAARDELGDERDDLRDRVARLGQLVGKAEPETADIVEIPLRRLRRERRARA